MWTNIMDATNLYVCMQSVQCVVQNWSDVIMGVCKNYVSKLLEMLVNH